MRGPVTSLPVTKGAERAKRVERGPGGGLAGLGAGGLWRRKGWETLGSQTPTKTGSLCGGQTASGAWAGTAHCWNEGRTLLAARPCTKPPAQSVAVWAAALTRNKLTLSAPADRRAAPCLPGTLRAGFLPAEVWRNSRQVKLLTLEEQCQIWTGPLVGTVDIWYWADPQLCCTWRQEAYLGARDIGLFPLLP